MHVFSYNFKAFGELDVTSIFGSVGCNHFWNYMLQGFGELKYASILEEHKQMIIQPVK